MLDISEELNHNEDDEDKHAPFDAFKVNKLNTEESNAASKVNNAEESNAAFIDNAEEPNAEEFNQENAHDHYAEYIPNQ